MPYRPKFLSEILFPQSDEQVKEDLEFFFRKFEEKNGQTDLSCRYTSMFPREQQEWLVENEPLRYFRGLPPFAQAFAMAKVKEHQSTGSIDMLPLSMIRLIASGKLESNDGRGR